MSLPKEMVEKFKEFGFNTYQSKAYIALASKGVMSAPEIATITKIPKSKIYEVLSSLTERRLIEEFPGSPKLFKGRPFNNVLSELIKEHEEKIERLKNNAKSLKKLSENLIENDFPENNIIWTVNGRKAFHEKMSEMSLRAQKEVIAISPRFSRHPLLDNALKESKSRGVIFKGITNLNKDTAHRIIFYSRYMDIKKYEDEIPITLVIVDKKECLYRIEYEVNGTKNYVGIHSTNKGLVKTFLHYWESLLENSSEIDYSKVKGFLN